MRSWAAHGGDSVVRDENPATEGRSGGGGAGAEAEGRGGKCPKAVHRTREKVLGTENLYKYVNYLFMEFDDAKSAQSFLAGHETFDARQKHEGVLRVNVHNELRFPLSLTTKPPWFRVVPMGLLHGFSLVPCGSQWFRVVPMGMLH